MTRVNASSVCRLCLNPSERAKCLWLHQTIVEQLCFVGWSLQCGSYAELLDYICNKCEEELERVYKFLVKLKLSKLRIDSHCAIANAERSCNRETQPFVKDEHSKPDFINDISEDYYGNEVDEEILQIPPIESNSVIDVDKRPMLIVDNIDKLPLADTQTSPISLIDSDQSSLLDDIDRPLIKLETSPINYSIDPDLHATLDDIDKPWGKIETSSIGSNSVIDLCQRPTKVLDDIDNLSAEPSPIIGSNSFVDLDQGSTQVVDDTELETSPIESCSVVDLDKRPILVVDDIDKPPLADTQTSPISLIGTCQSSFLDDIDRRLIKLETSPINYSIDPDRHAILDDTDNPLGKLETSSIGSNSVMGLDQRLTKVLDDIDKLLAVVESSPIIGSNSFTDLEQRPTQVLDDTELETSPVESYSIIDLDKRSIVVVDDIDKPPLADTQTSPSSYVIYPDQSSFLNDIDKPWGKLETSPIDYVIDPDQSSFLYNIDKPWGGNFETSSIGSNSIIDVDQRPTQVPDNINEPLAELETSPTESNSIIGQDKRPDDTYKQSAKIETSPTKSKYLIKRFKLKTSKHHTSLDVETYLCHICGKAYGLKSNLLRHIREHEGRRFTCTYKNCSSFFTQRTSLKLHIASHKGEKPFLCFLCNKNFSQRKSLQLHLKIHQGEHEHKCSYCSRGFHQKTNLVRHLETRCFSKIKKFQCMHCKNYFATKQSLNRHNAVHERQKEILEPVTQPCVKVQVLPITWNTFDFKNGQTSFNLL